MRGRILLGAGLAIGYVLGARAGRDAYDRLRLRATRVAHSPQVERAVDTAKATAVKAVEQAGSANDSPPAATLQEGTRASVPAADDPTATATD